MTSVHSDDLGVIGVVDAVTSRLRARILTGEIAAGEALTEAKVSELFRVARPSAKAAIEQLVSAGLLARTAHRSARVLSIDAEMISDVYRTRVRLESAALRELAASRRSVTDAARANAEIQRMPRHPSRETVDSDLRFHTALIDALGSPRTSRMYRSVADEVRLCMAQAQDRQLLDAGEISDQHAAMLLAVEAGDGDLAARLLVEHLTAAEKRLVQTVSSVSADRR